MWKSRWKAPKDIIHDIPRTFPSLPSVLRQKSANYENKNNPMWQGIFSFLVFPILSKNKEKLSPSFFLLMRVKLDCQGNYCEIIFKKKMLFHKQTRESYYHGDACFARAHAGGGGGSMAKEVISSKSYCLQLYQELSLISIVHHSRFFLVFLFLCRNLHKALFIYFIITFVRKKMLLGSLLRLFPKKTF